VSDPATQVLIADGDVDRSRRIAEACAARGLACQVAAHGGTALELALDELPRVLVSQVDLPLIDGPRLAAILRTNPRTRALQVLYLADRPQEAQREDLADRVLAAPVDPEAVAGCVQASLAAQPGARDGGPDTEPGGVTGELSQLALADLLQLFQVSRRTGAIQLEQSLGRGRRREGRVALRDGEVIAASAGATRAEKALYRMLAWDRGSFSFRPQAVADEVEITTPTRALLREGLRQLREWEQLAIELPPLGARAGLRVPRSALPSVIHPLTQEVLLALEHGSRVGDVVDRCSFPDYQVLRTLHTLIERGMVELRPEPDALIPAADARLFTSSGTARLREWLDLERPGGLAARRAKALVLAADAGATRRFAGLLARLPGVELAPPGGELAADDLALLARLAVEEQVSIELVHCPADPRFAPLWPLAAHGALAALFLLGAPAGRAAAALRPAARALAAAPRTRLLAVALLAAGEQATAEELAGHLPLLSADAFFALRVDDPAEAEARLRELLARILP
jgi:DNA-binding response OmpR family regulator